MIFCVTVLTSCIKLLLIPSYRSTDFEVHRNWLAITHSRPVKDWYYESTSEWTLDYPPFFAWFEYLLSFVAVYFDENMLKVDALDYSSNKTILFQRLSVIVTDLIYVYGVNCVCKCFPKTWKRNVVLPILLLTNCGLLMVDHIHYQYNGVLYGILLISISYMLQDKYIWSSFWFAFLLNMKHLYIYLAPAYFVYLLKHYCLNNQWKNWHENSKKFISRFSTLAIVVIGVFIASFLPFLYHLPQIIKRLFPFKRGLCHAYWAPNIWALYNCLDKFSVLTLSKLNNQTDNSNSTIKTATMTGGLVQEFSHSILPNISPLITMLLTLMFMLPFLVKLFSMKKNSLNFLRAIVLCGLTSFLFGWHVHEKAILMAIIPLSVLSIMDPTDAKVFLLLSITGHYSLFPLLFPLSLLSIKALLLILYSSYSFYSLFKVHSNNYYNKYSLPLLNVMESIYILGLIGIFSYENVIHKVLHLDEKLPFLPLLLTSVYCAIGIVYSWIKYYVYFMKISSK